MAYEFWAFNHDGTEHSIVGEDLEEVKQQGQEWMLENDGKWKSMTIYLPHENSEYAKNLTRNKFNKGQQNDKGNSNWRN